MRSPRALRALRTLRHSINYYGYEPSVAEVRDLQHLAQDVFEPLAHAIEEDINSGEEKNDV